MDLRRPRTRRPTPRQGVRRVTKRVYGNDAPRLINPGLRRMWDLSCGSGVEQRQDCGPLGGQDRLQALRFCVTGHVAVPAGGLLKVPTLRWGSAGCESGSSVRSGLSHAVGVAVGDDGGAICQQPQSDQFRSVADIQWSIVGRLAPEVLGRGDNGLQRQREQGVRWGIFRFFCPKHT